MKSSKLSYIVIILLALVVGVLSYSYLASSKTVIFLFNDDYSAGKAITPEMLTPTQINSSIVNETRGGVVYITSENVEQVLGDYLRIDVLSGTPLMSVYSDEVGGSGAEKRIEDDKVAVTISVNNISGGSPYIAIGTKVNIYTSYELEDERITKLELQNIRVVDVLYEDVQEESSGNLEIVGVTLELTPEESMSIQHASAFGEVRLGIIRGSTYEKREVPIYKTESIKTEEHIIPIENEIEDIEDDGVEED